MPEQSQNPRPRVITFSGEEYIPVLANWFSFARRAGSFDVVVYCLDRAAQDAAEAAGVATVLVDWNGSCGELWGHRLEIFADLVESGQPILHTDSDCVWLDDPLATCFGAGPDFVYSQGTIHPPSAHDAVGFVLCCGLFRVNATPAAARFLRKIASHYDGSGDDQTSLNELLMEGGTVWTGGDMPDYRLRLNGKRFACWKGPLTGHNPTDGIDIELAPHWRVQRIPDPTAKPANVVAKHLLSAKTVGAKLDEFRRQGLFGIRPDWQDVPRGAPLDAYFLEVAHTD